MEHCIVPRKCSNHLVSTMDGGIFHMTSRNNELAEAVLKAKANAKTKQLGALLIVEASTTIQKLWGKNLKDCLQIKKHNKCFTCVLQVNEHRVTGCGYSVKKAKEAACNHFIKHLKRLNERKERKERKNEKSLMDNG